MRRYPAPFRPSITVWARDGVIMSSLDKTFTPFRIAKRGHILRRARYLLIIEHFYR